MTLHTCHSIERIFALEAGRLVTLVTDEHKLAVMVAECTVAFITR
jgi:hypothetical protein